MMEHVLSPRNGGVMEHADLTGHAGTPGRGAFLILFLGIADGRIAAAKYHTVGCGPSIARASMLSEQSLGHSIGERRELSPCFAKQSTNGSAPTLDT
jgi:NifU-like protein involved in Fe-S cluster formation